MRKANFFFGLLLWGLCSCDSSSKQDDLVLPASTGELNSISLVIEDVLWNGEVGDAIRRELAAPVDGLQEEEPLLTINQFSPKIFNNEVKTDRNILIVTRGLNPEFKHVIDRYAAPQNVFFITGHNLDEIIQTINVHAKTLISSIQYYEIIESQRKTAQALFNDRKIKEVFDVTLQIPKRFSYALIKDKFIWLKKDVPSGNASLLLYEVPMSAFSNKNAVENTVRLRDSIGSKYIHGMLDHTRMVTEESYLPYLSLTKIDNKRAYEIRGTWELEDNYMNGPFLNYAIEDPENNRILIVEGFVYNPSSNKRDMIFELESIIKSIHFLKHE